MFKLLLVVFSVLLGIGMLATKSLRKHPTMARYDWFSGRSSPPFCPMEVESSAFNYRGGGSLYITPGRVNSPKWGLSNKLDIVGPDLKRLPDSLTITYYSFWEDAIYHAQFDLPYERIEKLFADGFLNLGSRQTDHRTYERVYAGIAPGGAVTVWLAGVGRQKEVFFGYAQQIDADWNQTLNHSDAFVRQKYRTEVLAELPENAITRQYKQAVPFGLWERLRQRYAWSPVFENVPRPKYLYPVEYFNGENDDIQLPEVAPPAEGRAAPSTLSYAYVETVRGKPTDCDLDVTFDQDEMLQAFEKLGGQNTRLELVLRREEPGEYPTQVLLRNEKESIVLSKVKYARRGAL